METQWNSVIFDQIRQGSTFRSMCSQEKARQTACESNGRECTSGALG